MFNYLFRIITNTADMIRMIPMAICSVKISLKNISPTVIAVTGSIAPKTDVMVDPIRFIA